MASEAKVKNQALQHFVNVMKDKPHPIPLGNLQGHLGQVSSEVYAYIINNYSGSNFGNFFKSNPKFFIVNRHGVALRKEPQNSKNKSSPASLATKKENKATALHDKPSILSSHQSSKKVVLRDENELEKMDSSDDYLTCFHILYYFVEVLKVKAPILLTNLSSYYGLMSQVMKNYILSINGSTVPHKISYFLNNYSHIIKIDSESQVSLQSDGLSLYSLEFLKVIKTLIIKEIQQGCNDINKLLHYINETFGMVPLSTYWKNIDTQTFNNFFKKFRYDFFVPGDGFVYLFNSSFIQNPSISEDVVDFYLGELKLHKSGIFYRDLPLHLDMKKPELLAILKERDPVGISCILWNNEDFCFKNGFVNLRKVSSKQATCEDKLPLSHDDESEMIQEVCQKYGLVLKNWKGSIDFLSKKFGFLTTNYENDEGEIKNFQVFFYKDIVLCDHSIDDLCLLFQCGDQVLFDAAFSSNFQQTAGSKARCWTATSVQIIPLKDSLSSEEEFHNLHNVFPHSCQKTESKDRSILPKNIEDGHKSQTMCTNILDSHLNKHNEVLSVWSSFSKLMGKIVLMTPSSGFIRQYCKWDVFIHFTKDVEVRGRNTDDLTAIFKVGDSVLCDISHAVNSNLLLASRVNFLSFPLLCDEYFGTDNYKKTELSNFAHSNKSCKRSNSVISLQHLYSDQTDSDLETCPVSSSGVLFKDHFLYSS